MDPVQQKLERLRVWFFVWFVGQAAIGIVTATWVGRRRWLGGVVR